MEGGVDLHGTDFLRTFADVNIRYEENFNGYGRNDDAGL